MHEVTERVTVMLESLAEAFDEIAEKCHQSAVKARTNGDLFTCEYARGGRDMAQRMANDVRAAVARSRAELERSRYPTVGGASPIGPNPHGIPENALVYPDTTDG